MPHRLHYIAAGRPVQPTVLLIHGFMGRAEDWAQAVEALCPDVHCLAVDLPGHGGSLGLPDEAFSFEAVSASLAEVLDAEHVEQASVIGYSMGGRLALHFALTHPERCRALVLESASPGLRTDDERAERRRLDAERADAIEADYEAFLERWYRQPLFASLADRDGLVERMTEQRRSNDPAELARALRTLGTGRQPSLWERLGALRVPTLALTGTRDEKYARLAEAMAEASEAVTATLIPEAGHIPHAEQPTAFLTHTRDFITQHDEFHG